MMTRPIDFVDQLRASTSEFNPPVQSLMDVDFYKFTMGQFIYEYFPDVEVTFKLIVRDPTIPIADLIYEPELRKCLDYCRDLRFDKSDLYYLRGQDLYGLNLLKEPYLEFLRTFKLPPYKLSRRDGAFELTFRAKWAEATMWETIALAVISELYYRAVLKNVPQHELEIVYARAKVKLYTKLEQLQGRPRVRFADFGQRRRHSREWQRWVVALCKQMMGAQFTGTSNTMLARDLQLDAIGTNAHELPMVHAALADNDEGLRYSQYDVLELWQKMYGQGLRIVLPDTFGSAQFFAHAPAWVAEWRGQRQDSGNPKAEGDRYVEWLKVRGVDPAERVTIFSDGLDVGPMLSIDAHFEHRHQHPYGWGTLLTNDFEKCLTGNPLLRPFSMVCKVVEANGRPCVKLSNNPNKATGPQDEIERYKKVFGSTGHEAQKVMV